MYPKINGYAITPYDVNGELCYAIRDGNVGNLIRNQDGLALIFASEALSVEVAKSADKCSNLVNFTLELI